LLAAEPTTEVMTANKTGRKMIIVPLRAKSLAIPDRLGDFASAAAFFMVAPSFHINR
jgi:hypothetical protein